MASDRPTLPITRVFINFFHSFPKLVITNLLFAVPLAVFSGIFYALSSISGMPLAAAMFIRLLIIIPLFPFYAGVTQVTAHLVMGETEIKVTRDFFTAVKENFKRFLAHGAVFYAAVIFSYFSISFYATMIGENPVMFAPMIISIIVAVFVLFMFFYIPPMTVTFDLPMKTIYKNSLLMSFGELVKNFIALFAIFLVFIFSSTLLFACMGNVTAIIIVTILLAAAFVPAVTSFFINSAVYERMYYMVIDNTAEIRNIENKIEETRQKKEPKKFDSDSVKDEFSEKLKNFEIDENADGDEYLFFEGRMIKRSVLIRMKNEVLESELK